MRESARHGLSLSGSSLGTAATTHVALGPLAPLAALIAVFLLARYPSPFGWDALAGDPIRHWSLLATHAVGWGLGSVLGIEFARKINIRSVAIFQFLSVDHILRAVLVVFAVSTFFMAAKFVGIRGIPALSADPLIRSRDSLGGYVDLPARLQLVSSLFAWWIARKHGRRYLPASVVIGVTILMQALFLNRGHLVFLVVGMTFIDSFISTSRRKSVIKLGIGVALSALAVVLLFFVRYVNFRSSIADSFSLGFWVLHGNITAGTSMGAMVADYAPGSLWGRYTFGSYLSVLVPRFNDHGAEYIRQSYMPMAETAQSIGHPFGFFVDFGIAGIAILSMLSGLILGASYDVARRSQAPVAIVIYWTLFFQAIWGIRSGSFIIDPVAAYFMVTCVFIAVPTPVAKGGINGIGILKLGLIATWVIGLLFLVMRI